jgi:hypothetical protein
MRLEAGIGYNISIVLLDACHVTKRLLLIMDSDNNSIRYSKVEISDSGIIEHAGDGIVVAIPRGQIRQIKLCYDTKARNPFCQYFLGFTLFSLGVIGLGVTFLAGLSGVLLAQAGPGTFAIPLVPVTLWLMVGAGFWLLMGIFSARYHLLIDSEGGVRKIFFDKSADITDIRQFIRRAHLDYGYAIDVSVLEKSRLSS